MDFGRLFAYDEWANREEIATLQKLDGKPEQAVKLLGHIIGAEWLWLARLTRSPQTISVWPELTLRRCEGELDRLHVAWKAFLPHAEVESSVQYVNTRGDAFTSRVEDVLMHVILHGGYHRGQIATVVRAGGEGPAYTDYIHCTRNGFI